MRAALWFLALFGVAVAIALFAGNNQGTITVFWPPYRVDLSLNMVLLVLVASFIVLHTALRALAALLDIPQQARRWRLQQRERAMYGALIDAITHQTSGRFVRARKAAQAALTQESYLDATGQYTSPGPQLRMLAHLLAADSAHALQDRTERDKHFELALKEADSRNTTQGNELREGIQMRSARWAVDDRDAPGALARLKELPHGAARRTLALRTRLKAARLASRPQEALETARLLAKHRAFSPAAAQSIVRGLVNELIQTAHDVTQLQRVWAELDPAERKMPELSLRAAVRLQELGGEAAQGRQWLQEAWDDMVAAPHQMADHLRTRLVRAMEANLDSLDPAWLARIESAQQANPRDAHLQYLAGMACLQRQLWGKAQQLLTQSIRHLDDAGLRRRAWRTLAVLAERRKDDLAAAEAWKQAAQAD